SAASSCMNKITSWQGTFRSPGYKSGYPADIDCYWLISVDQGNIIEIEFEDFSVEKSEYCLKDYVEIHEGPTIVNNSSLSHRLCGSSLTQKVFQSRGHVVLVRMRTDDTGSNRGFEASHRGLCHANMTSSHGIIRSPGYPSLYQGPTNCSWLIDRGPGYYTTISVHKFLLNNHTDCQSNHIKIYEVEKGDSAVLTICRGANDSTNITTKGAIRVTMVLDEHMAASLQASYNTTDVDECSNNTLNVFPCVKTAKCHNNDGSFICTCNQGYQGNGQRCSDIDECFIDKHDCHVNTTVCVNTVGSYRCPCKVGYTGTDNNCTDIDECSLPQHNCHAKAECTNNIGSFWCKCMNGYRGSGVNCIDVNECLERIHGCRIGAICINRAGSYTCPCRDGFNYDKQTARCISGSLSSYASEGDDVTYYHTDNVASRDYEFHNLSFHTMENNPKRYPDHAPAYSNHRHYDMHGHTHAHAHIGENTSHRLDCDLDLDQMQSVEV
ncbi:hypothetical protein QZH41_016456, partial [Actinostola sp. cb2023]